MEALTALTGPAAAGYAALDAVISPAVFGFMQHVGMKVKPISPLVKGLPLVDSPTPLAILLAIYLFVVVLGVMTITPKTDGEKAKDPAWLSLLISCHNIFLVGLSGYMCFTCVYEAVQNNYMLWGNGYKQSEAKLARVLYIFYVSKIYEFLDTFIMLLKGNMRQVSFLHVYHHGTIAFIWWAIICQAPGGDAYFSAAMNSWVHVVMYAYYQLSVLLKDAGSRKKYLWWGRYLTQMQMGQFVLNMVQAAYCLVYSAYPRNLSGLLLGYMMTLLALFGDFYIRKHVLAGGRGGDKGAGVATRSSTGSAKKPPSKKSN